MIHFISFHPLPSGCIQVRLSCTRISDKVPGKLGGASTGDTRLLSKIPRHHVARSRFRTSIQTLHIRILQQERSLSEIARLHVQNSPVYRFSSPDFNVSSTIHVHLAIMSQPSTQRNSTMPLPSFFVGRWLLAEQPEILMQWFAFVSLLQCKLH